MIYTDSKGKEHEVHDMSTNHLRNSIKKNGDEISRYNPALLAEMKTELNSRPDNILPADKVPKITGTSKLLDNSPGQGEVSDDF